MRRGSRGLKARWVGDAGQNVIEINTPSGNADIKVDSEAIPTIEYVQEGERRTVAVKHINNLSCELSRETMDQIATPRGAAIAMCVGGGYRSTRLVCDFGGAGTIGSKGSTDRNLNAAPCFG